MNLFGTGDWAARLVPAFSSFLTILATFFFGRRMFGALAGFLAATSLIVSAGFLHSGRFLVLDSTLSLFVCLALFMAYEAIRDVRSRTVWWIASAACCGLGVLIKGPLALVLVLPPLLACHWLNRGTVRSIVQPFLGYVGIVTAIAAPWYVAMLWRVPDFAANFFWKHNVVRFVAGLGHEQPVWFYLPVLLIMFMPGTLLIYPAIRALVSRSMEAAALRTHAVGFALLWAVWCFAFFSCATDKLPGYILPALPAVALLLGWYLDKAIVSASLSRIAQTRLSVMSTQALSAVAAGILMVFTAAWAFQLESTTLWLLETALCLLAITASIVFGRNMPPALAWSLCIVFCLGLNFESARQLVPAWAFSRSPFAESGEVKELLCDAETAVVLCDREWGSVPFYSGRNDVFCTKGRTSAELNEFLQCHPRALLLVRRRKELEELWPVLPHGLRMTRVFDSNAASAALVEGHVDRIEEARRPEALYTTY